MSRSDRVIGITLGLLIGVVTVILFVSLGGAESIDPPSLDTGDEAAQQQDGAGRR